VTGDGSSDGGDTVFPEIRVSHGSADGGLAVSPVAGMVVWWANAHPSHPLETDPRVVHEARAPRRGEKVSANFFVRAGDVQAFFERGCLPGAWW
jgi:hypothetical protein